MYVAYANADVVNALHHKVDAISGNGFMHCLLRAGPCGTGVPAPCYFAVKSANDAVLPT